MDQQLLRAREAKCIQEEPPGCTAACPVHVDARGMIAAMRKGDYAASVSLYHKAVPFPRIISRVCDQPCRGVCKRKEVDEAISINALERVCVEQHEKPVKITVPRMKDKKAAVVGAGLSGMMTALELARKGYAVTVFEATDRLGGSLWDFPEEQLPRQLIAADFAIFGELPVEIRYNTAIGERGGSVMSFAQLCEEFDAVYLGVGCKEMHAIDLELARDAAGDIAIDPATLATSHAKVFAGGSLRRCGAAKPAPISDVCDGRMAAVSMDRFMQGASLTANRVHEGPYTSKLYTNIKGVKPQPRVAARASAGGYNKEEAAQEAGRCLSCECMECVKACEYLRHYGGYPKSYARSVYNNLSIVMGIHQANKMINTCALCGQCENVCPGKLDMGEICHEARQMMVKKGKMPPSAHDFALRDMDFSNSHHFGLNRHQPGFTKSEVVFFPSCQLAASSPQHVKKVYDFLCAKIDGGVGLMLGCCGAPANWAGQEDLFKETLSKIEANWRELGSPKVITACPTCFAMFKHNTEMPVETLYTVFERIGLPADAGKAIAPKKLALHDSCTTRHDARLQDSIRQTMKKLGHEVEELPLNRDNTSCCGYGGLMIYANKDVAHKVIAKRINESDTDYVAYCAMCRDNFASQEKRVYHLLDLIFGADEDNLAEQAPSGYSQRQENRAKLKTALLREIWGEAVEDRQYDVKLIIPANVRRVMEDSLILSEDVAGVIARAESTGNRLKNAETGHYLAYLQPLKVTYWVEYTPQEDGFLVHNAYSHRLEITE